MSDVFLGIIAVAVLTMAVIQVAAIIVAVRLIRRVDRMASRLEEEIQPVLAGLRTLAADAARATNAFRAVVSVFRGGRRSGAASPDEEGPLFVG